MPSKPIDLPLLRGPKPATLYYLAHTKAAEPVRYNLQFLHRVRDRRWLAQLPDWATGDEAVAYYEQLPTAAAALAAELGDLPVDLVAAAPSRRRDAEPYLAAIKRRRRDAHDVSRSVHRVGNVSAGETTEPTRFVAHVALTYATRFDQFRDVLIVDDVYSAGTTAAALLFRMEQLGLPTDARVSVAAPLLATPTE